MCIEPLVAQARGRVIQGVRRHLSPKTGHWIGEMGQHQREVAILRLVHELDSDVRTVMPATVD